VIEQGHSERLLRFGLFEVDLQTREVRRQGMKIRLQDQPFQVLVALLERPGTVVTRRELQARIWPPDTFVDFDLGLNTAVTRLRQALGDTADNPRFIETLPRLGYRFIAPLSSGVGTDVGPPASSVPGTESGPHVSALANATTVWVALAACLSVTILLIAAQRVGWPWRSTQGGPVPIQSIAVLPLENLSHDPEQQYFADGMTDALIADLAQIRGVRVISRTSVMRYKHVRTPLREIANELHVDAIVEGSVARSTERVRISAQLIEAKTDRHLWATTYERAPADVVALQQEVAEAIANEIRATVSVQERTRLSRAQSVEPLAYEAYLRGRYLLNTRTETALRKAIKHFDEAVKGQPAFAPAYAGLADSYLRLGFWGVLAPDDAYPRSKATAKRALELDETLAWAHSILAANRFQYDLDWAGADQEFKRALELDPNHVPDWYPGYLSLIGRAEESLALAQRARELDPLSLPVSADVSTYMNVGQYDEGVDQLRKLLDLEPNYALARYALGILYRYQEKPVQSVAELEKAINLSDRNPRFLARLGNAYGAAGQVTKARAILDELFERAYVSPFHVAIVYLGLGDKERAFEFLARASQHPGGELHRLRVEPLFVPLHSDARFAALVRRMHFPS
jgi:TolB-like protein/DNA-binding winged helix-turn-helix (wHTH) protein/Tfp pilus assembly protein PilF